MQLNPRGCSKCLFFRRTPCHSGTHDRTTHRKLLPYFVSILAPYYRLQSAVEIGSVSPECKLGCDVVSPGGYNHKPSKQDKKKKSHNWSHYVITLSILFLSHPHSVFLIAKLFNCFSIQISFQPTFAVTSRGDDDVLQLKAGVRVKEETGAALQHNEIVKL